MAATDTDLRSQIIARCIEMNALGINQGTSGNISARSGDGVLITPSAVPYDELQPEMLTLLADDGTPSGPCKPSSEWRFHLALMLQRSEIGAVIHAHPPFCTALAIARREIPACHYMVAAFGGNSVRLADYALFGGDELSANVITAMQDRSACLMANHGAVVVGADLGQAMWRLVELEALARQYLLSLQVPGGPVMLTDEEMAEMHRALAGYLPKV